MGLSLRVRNPSGLAVVVRVGWCAAAAGVMGAWWGWRAEQEIDAQTPPAKTSKEGDTDRPPTLNIPITRL